MEEESFLETDLAQHLEPQSVVVRRSSSVLWCVLTSRFYADEASLRPVVYLHFSGYSCLPVVNTFIAS